MLRGFSAGGDAPSPPDAPSNTKVTSAFLQELESRGFVHQYTDASALDESLNKGVVSAYIGFDATAPSLHIGSLVQIMMLRHLQRSGHKPVVVMGGGTTKIGDPSGRDLTRQILTESVINDNVESIGRVFRQFLHFGDGATDAVIVNNAEWLDKLEYMSFLRDVGPHFTINRMLTFESVKSRLEREQPLTFLEFNYMILQVQSLARPRSPILPQSPTLPQSLTLVQLHDPAGLRLHRAPPAAGGDAAAGGQRPMGKHRQRHGAGPTPAPGRVARGHGAPHHHQVSDSLTAL